MAGLIRIGLSRGYLLAPATRLLSAASLDLTGVPPVDRSLVVRRGDFEYVVARSSDVASLTELGALELAVVGSDILAERAPTVSELLDLGIGKCRLVVAGPAGTQLRAAGLRVATPYPRTAARYFEDIGLAVEILALSGSSEVAPSIGVADVIVDLVETGATLRANGLVVLREIAACTARLIAPCRDRAHLDAPLIDALIERLAVMRPVVVSVAATSRVSDETLVRV